MKRAVWISWENHRRTSELAKVLDVELIQFESNRNRLIKYIQLSIKTLGALINKRPEIFIVQNPSIILAFLASVLKPLFRYKLIVDRHTNFLLNNNKYNYSNRLFILLSNISLKKADLTIVTNQFLKEYVELKEGRSFVLPDKLPEMMNIPNEHDNINNIVTFICTYASDEPYGEVIQAAGFLDPHIKIYMTGNDKKIDPELFNNMPNNLIATGFLPEEEYEKLLKRSDIIMDFTALDHCMVCGAYEAVSLGKPLITSDTTALKNYFNKGTKHIQHTPSEICGAIMTIYKDYPRYYSEMGQLKAEIEMKWNEQFVKLRKLIYQ